VIKKFSIMTIKIKNVLYILLTWFIAGLLYSAQSYYYRTQVGQPVDWLTIILTDTPYFLFWALFTPIPLYLFKKIPYKKSNLLRFTLVHSLSALVVSFTQAFLYNTFRITVFSTDIKLTSIYINTVANFDYGLLVYFVVLLVIGVYNYYRQSQQLQTALIQAQLDAVRSRLQPHFLFNTLNSIAVLIKESPAQAADTVKSLSDLLRYVLKNIENQFSTLEKEIEFLRQYLSIEQVRFGPRLDVKINYSEDLNKLYIPTLILQPLVENAIQHGIAKHRGKGFIVIDIKKEKDVMHVMILNSGSYNSDKNNKNGIGLKMTSDRLNALFGADYTFKLGSTPSGSTQALIEIPVPGELGE
jgi:two-component system, LytTR family, sensor kinase